MNAVFRTALVAAAVVVAGCTKAPPTPPAQAPAVGHRVKVNGMQLY